MHKLVPQVADAKKIFIGLLQSESNYIQNLKNAIKNYLIPLRTKATESGELQDVITIFSNIETIVDIHTDIYNGMVNLQEESWPIIDGLGLLFLKVLYRSIIGPLLLVFWVLLAMAAYSYK